MIPNFKGNMPQHGQPRQRLGGILAVVVAASAVAGCEVTNPGPVQDEFLNDPSSHAALVAGAERRVMDGVLRTEWPAILITTREAFPSGDSNGPSPRQMAGVLPEGSGDWRDLQEARFIAEDALRRFALPGITADPKLVVQAHIWAGYALRVLGENWCQAVLEGGPLQSYTVALQRAEKHFTDALGNSAITAEQKNQALAGRAQVRMGLKDWAGASADAAQVPLAYVLNVNPDKLAEATRNPMGFYNDNSPYRVFSMKHTYFEDYFTQTGDPRVPWTLLAGYPSAGSRLTGYIGAGQAVPYLRLMEPGSTTSHYQPSTKMALARGTEMRLIQAEAILMQTPGSFAQAQTLINQARTFYVSMTGAKAALAPYPTRTNATDVWTDLKTERFIDGFAQAKRLFDIARWTRDNTPGTYPWSNWEPLSTIFSSETPWSTYRGADNPKGICFQVPNSERLANPNISDDIVL